MNAMQYEKWTSWIRQRPAAIRALKGVNEGLKYLCYVLYPLLLILLALNEPSFLAREIIVPVVLFVALSVFRKAVNAQRPYEVLDIDPLIYKSTKGKSFPSRHIFSVFMIAMCWLAYCIPVGCVLLACGVVMAVIRVLGGVHFPKDVIAGALVGIIGGIVGLWLIPWP